MRLTTKGRFAVTAMMDLALRESESPVSLASISERQGISLSYLEQLFAKLRRNGIVESVRGPGGGYYVGRPMIEITVADIIRAVDEALDATQCGGYENCREDHQCMTHDLWTTLSEKMYEYLTSVTLHHLVEQERAKQAAAEQNKLVVIEDKRPARKAGAKLVVNA